MTNFFYLYFLTKKVYIYLLTKQKNKAKRIYFEIHLCLALTHCHAKVDRCHLVIEFPLLLPSVQFFWIPHFSLSTVFSSAFRDAQGEKARIFFRRRFFWTPKLGQHLQPAGPYGAKPAKPASVIRQPTEVSRRPLANAARTVGLRCSTLQGPNLPGKPFSLLGFPSWK